MALAQELTYYTYADVLDWDESVRAEIIDGEIYMLTTPNTSHQWVSRELFGRLYDFLSGKPCQLFSAPFGVRLFPKDDLSDDTMVEPDIMVICDASKLDQRGCNGAPDLIIEILSPSTARHDQKLKFQKYQEAGVREYRIVDPDQTMVHMHILENGQYTTKVYDEIPVTVLPGCVIKLKDVFTRPWAAAAKN
jgi:Uma2 family endonuclease